VRVQFAGSCARQVAKSHIASGDEVCLCLDGVEWIQDGDSVSTPGRGVEFELRFTERLLLKVRLVIITLELSLKHSATVSTRRFSRFRHHRS
jgi:hypothetical protein